MPAPETLRRRLAELEAEGARAYDAPGLRFVETLLERAGALPGGAAARLLERAEARIERLAGALAAAREQTARAVDELGGELDREAAGEALDRGDLVAVRRALRRRRASPPSAPRRRLPVIPTTAPDAPDPARGTGSGRSRRRRRRPASAPSAAGMRYRAAFAELATGVRIERSRASLPAAPGPYNGQTIAARVIETAADLSPLYAHSQLERMRDLAILSLLPEPGSKPRRKKS